MEVNVSRYETKARGEIGTGVLWVEYPNRFPGPLEKDMKGLVHSPSTFVQKFLLIPIG